MKNAMTTVFLLAAFVGCGPVVEVPNASVGKILTPDGLSDDIIETSSFRLNFAGPGIIPDKLIVCSAPDEAIMEEIPVFMPKDELNLSVDVRAVCTISKKRENVNKIFDKIEAEESGSRVMRIPFQYVYVTYGQNVIREITRNVLSDYEIAQVLASREQLAVELTQAVNAEFDRVGAPIQLVRIGFGDLQPPDVIKSAMETAAAREVEIARAEADKAIRMKQAEADLEVATKQQEVDLKEAETQVLVAEKLAEGVSEPFVVQRALKILEKLAESPNKVFILPQEAISNPAVMTGLNFRALGEDNDR